MKSIRIKIVAGIIVVVMLLLASNAMNTDPATNRAKRIEKKLGEMDLKLDKLGEMDLKLDQLIALVKKWE